MPLWIVIGVAAAVFVLVIVVAASFNVFSAETGDEAQERWTGLPEGFTSADLDAVSFRPALRGYRMEDVDEAMQILQERLHALESAAAAKTQPSPDIAGAKTQPSPDAVAAKTQPSPDAVAAKTQTSPDAVAAPAAADIPAEASAESSTSDDAAESAAGPR